MTPEEFESVLPGVQLAAFEVLWPAIPALELVGAKVCGGGLEIRCEPKMSRDDEEACRGLLDDICGVAFPGIPVDIRFEVVERGSEWRTVISEDLLRVIAADVAPWQLEQGR